MAGFKASDDGGIYPTAVGPRQPSNHQRTSATRLSLGCSLTDAKLSSLRTLCKDCLVELMSPLLDDSSCQRSQTWTRRPFLLTSYAQELTRKKELKQYGSRSLEVDGTRDNAHSKCVYL